jgi:hypothetical protein
VNLQENIELAFGSRRRPNSLVEARTPVTPEQKEAIWFGDREWSEITWEDWEGHRDAFYAFTPEAFAYYLPSVLKLAERVKIVVA